MISIQIKQVIWSSTISKLEFEGFSESERFFLFKFWIKIKDIPDPASTLSDSFNISSLSFHFAIAVFPFPIYFSLTGIEFKKVPFDDKSSILNFQLFVKIGVIVQWYPLQRLSTNKMVLFGFLPKTIFSSVRGISP